MQEASAAFVIDAGTATSGPSNDAQLRHRLSPTVLGLLHMENTYPHLRVRSVSLLQLVEQVPGLSTGDCSRVLGIPRPAITRITNSLTDYGLMQSVRDKRDKRLTRYTATARGTLLLGTLHLAPASYAAA